MIYFLDFYFVVKRSTLAEIVKKIDIVFKYAMEQDVTQKFMEDKIIKIAGISGLEADRLISKVASYDTWGFISVGEAINSPDTFGIPTP